MRWPSRLQEGNPYQTHSSGGHEVTELKTIRRGTTVTKASNSKFLSEGGRTIGRGTNGSPRCHNRINELSELGVLRSYVAERLCRHGTKSNCDPCIASLSQNLEPDDDIPK